LIVFCREPIPGQTKTRLMTHLGARDCAALAEAFIVDTLAKASVLARGNLIIAGTADGPVERTPFFRRVAGRFGAKLIDQGRGSLGTRMERALAPFATDGALLIGTDLPSLPLHAVRDLCRILARRRIVFGPSLDGGYYAIGVRGPMPPVFDGIRWGSGRVLENTMHRLERAGLTAALGPVWHDVDRWPDVMLLCEYLQRIELNSARDAHPCPATVGVLRRLGLLARRR
jgi:rSAM/selenodomain-associated transferase 1